jgi:hypothetical protein
MIISIHQPNYLPWLGFFDKISKSDIFIIFDNVQYPRSKEFGNRNLIKTNNGTKWLTVPLIGKSDFKNFNTIEINYNGWNEEHLNLIKFFYKKAPHFNEYYPTIETILNVKYKSLSDLNISLIHYFLKCLDVKVKIMLCSEMCSVESLKGSEKIMYLLKQLNATKYISGTGPGSTRYINEKEFSDNNIELIWQHYKHPTYNQLYGNFIPNLSIIDLLFNEGIKSKEIIRNI